MKKIISTLFFAAIIFTAKAQQVIFDTVQNVRVHISNDTINNTVYSRWVTITGNGNDFVNKNFKVACAVDYYIGDSLVTNKSNATRTLNIVINADNTTICDATTGYPISDTTGHSWCGQYDWIYHELNSQPIIINSYLRASISQADVRRIFN